MIYPIMKFTSFTNPTFDRYILLIPTLYTDYYNYYDVPSCILSNNLQ